MPPGAPGPEHGARPVMEDISPDTARGVIGGGASTAGVMVGLAGDEAALYAVSLNAGIWKSVHGSPWTQLARSPERAVCIAQDPNDPSHLAAGERGGDAVEERLNQSGVWESHDAGLTWAYVCDPLAEDGCRSQAIAAVAFSRQSTLFMAATCGIGRKPAGAAKVDFSHSPRGLGPVTALAVSQSRVWARTADKLLFSADDGLSWTIAAIPTTLPSATGPDGARYSISFHGRGSLYSLAALDNMAVMVFKPDPDLIGNHNSLLYFRPGSADPGKSYPDTGDPAGAGWQIQVLSSGDGTGLGGRRFVKSFILNRPDLPDAVGGRLQLFFGAGQEVQQAIGWNAEGLLEWDRSIQTDWVGPPHDTKHIHSDIWDFHVGSSYGPDRLESAWVAGDGGIFQAVRPPRPASELPARIYDSDWVCASSGLHTQHIHTLTLLQDGSTSRLAYATGDNDAWFTDSRRDSRGKIVWGHEGWLGDANWTAGDAGNPAMAMLVRRSAGFAMLTYFGKPPPPRAATGEQQAFTLNHDETFDGPAGFAFIQTPLHEARSGENAAYPLLDAVMLTNLPLRFREAGDRFALAPGELGKPAAGGPVLIRCRQFAAQPDADRSQFRGWSVEARGLPPGARGFCVSGGHRRPVYYVYARENTGLVLYKSGPSGWRRLDAGDLIDAGRYGPVFVNPYDPEVIFVLTTRGVRVSRNGGASFAEDAVLTALLTASGRFPLTGDFGGGSGRYVPAGGRANAMGTLSHVSFSRDEPAIVVASSPFTGLFCSLNSDRHWRDLTPQLPRPFTPVSSTAVDSEGVYAAMEGRSLVRITGYRQAPLASYFEVSIGASLAVLRDAAGRGLAGAAVRIVIQDDRRRLAYQGYILTNETGALRLPSPVAATPGSHTVELAFPGLPGIGPAHILTRIGLRPSSENRSDDNTDPNQAIFGQLK